MVRTPAYALSLMAVLIPLAACGSSTEKAAPKRVAVQGRPGRTTTVDTAYDPKIDPSRFIARITNPYLPWKTGRRWIYTGSKDGQPQRVEVTVTKERKRILGVECVVVRDVVTVNHTLHEKTVDWYAQDDTGNVRYFGEHTGAYTTGREEARCG